MKIAIEVDVPDQFANAFLKRVKEKLRVLGATSVEVHQQDTYLVVAQPSLLEEWKTASADEGKQM